ncbi:MAG: acyltransferase [Betaproteobacteria bacterium]|nr:acyltransferase [Betaproteobacteria bacterium]
MKGSPMISLNIVSKDRLDTVQALRGVSAFVVVLAHISFIGVGVFGVDIFFCISGFIMMYVTENESRRFLQKRAMRILPLYWLITFVMFFVILIAPKLVNSNEASVEYLLKSLFFIPYKRNGLTQPIIPVGWTLNFEIMFYVLFFISVKINKNYRHFICSGALAFIVLLGLFIKTENVIFTFVTNPIILEFALGMFAYIIFKKYNINSAGSARLKIASFISFLAMFLIAYYIPFLYHSFIIFDIHVHRSVLYGIPSMILLLCFIMAFKGCKLPKLMVVMGDMSFSLYLVHLPVVIFFDRVVYSMSKIDVFSLITAFAAIICSILSAYILWYCIENKFTKYLSNFLFPRHAL